MNRKTLSNTPEVQPKTAATPHPNAKPKPTLTTTIVNIIENIKTGSFTRIERLRLRSEIQHLFKQQRVRGKYFTCCYTITNSTEVVPVEHPRHGKLFGYNRDAYVDVLRNMGAYPEHKGQPSDGAASDGAADVDGNVAGGVVHNNTAITVGVFGVSGFRKVTFVASKKVHKRANVRNRIKRQMRHMYRLNRHNLPAGTKMIIIAHKRIIEEGAAFDQMNKDFGQMVARIATYSKRQSLMRHNKP